MEGQPFPNQKCERICQMVTESPYSNVRQLNGSLVLAFLNMVRDKLFGHKRDLLFREFHIQRCNVMAYNEPLSAFAADNGFH